MAATFLEDDLLCADVVFVAVILTLPDYDWNFLI